MQQSGLLLRHCCRRWHAAACGAATAHNSPPPRCHHVCSRCSTTTSSSNSSTTRTSSSSAQPSPGAAYTAAAAPAQPRVLDAASGPALLDSLDTLLFDQDGVLWRGQELVPNAVEALHVFRAAGKRLLFVTNNSSKSRAEYVHKFAGLGIDVAAEEIISSSYTAAAYLDDIGFRQQQLAAGQAPCVLLMGSPGMRDELEAVGLQVLDAEELQLPLMDNVGDMLAMQLDPRIGAVVLGWDARFTYSKLVYATALLREQRCLFIASNLDNADAISSSSDGGDGPGRVMPGTGSLVAALQVASGVQPVNVGKGGAWLFPHLLQRYQLEPSRTAMIGDRLDTDIAMGKQGGLVTLLPLTGVTSLADAFAAPPAEAPDFVLSSVAALAGLHAFPCQPVPPLSR